MPKIDQEQKMHKIHSSTTAPLQPPPPTHLPNSFTKLILPGTHHWPINRAGPYSVCILVNKNCFLLTVKSCPPGIHHCVQTRSNVWRRGRITSGLHQPSGVTQLYCRHAHRDGPSRVCTKVCQGWLSWQVLADQHQAQRVDSEVGDRRHCVERADQRVDYTPLLSGRCKYWLSICVVFKNILKHGEVLWLQVHVYHYYWKRERRQNNQMRVYSLKRWLQIRECLECDTIHGRYWLNLIVCTLTFTSYFIKQAWIARR